MIRFIEKISESLRNLLVMCMILSIKYPAQSTRNERFELIVIAVGKAAPVLRRPRKLIFEEPTAAGFVTGTFFPSEVAFDLNFSMRISSFKIKMLIVDW